jgi:hypothetical protein
MTHSGLMGMESGQEACTGRTAPGTVVHLGEPDTVSGESVQIGSPDFRTETADVRIAHIIN